MSRISRNMITGGVFFLATEITEITEITPIAGLAGSSR